MRKYLPLTFSVLNLNRTFCVNVFMNLITEGAQGLLQLISDLVITFTIQMFISDWEIIPHLF